MNTTNKKIIIAPLNWGLGHATRCVPIIKALIENSFTPIIASDGNALEFLRKEFPNLKYIELPTYNISYHRNIKLGLFLQFPKILKAVEEEKKVINKFIKQNKDVVGIISDNRFGVRSTLVSSVYITHQINVLSGKTTFLTSFFHQKIIKKFDECWIPDNENSQFSGKLSLTNKKINSKFIGVLSRFKKEGLEQKIDVLVILSGVEPNRTILEKKLIKEFKNDARNIVFVLGKVEVDQKKWITNHITFYNYLVSNQLQEKINSSKIVICRSGYSSIMDLAVLQKKAFFIPTKNQTEQEYLALYLSNKKIAPFCNINNFTKDKLLELEKYTGLKVKESKLNSNLFSLFKRK
ncbi:glycosyltransferase [Polaribacter sp. Z022]|uniref:glycosyltransferase n=1 Tax=Polaribacter sp. Z022 TaxID=2927125 RepID=UPI002021C2F8|nr:glycosyltransferase [Polaribacter sp. Z022]MCL7752809.1 glycosyltransferase [Polaribacter sp. Z022]